VRPRVPASNEGGVLFLTNYVKDFEGRFCDFLEIFRLQNWYLLKGRADFEGHEISSKYN
jgi:hypothetical protein